MAFKLQQNSKILRNKKNRKFERPAYIKKKKMQHFKQGH